MGFAFSKNPPLDKSTKFTNDAWLAINGQVFEKEEESIEIGDPSSIKIPFIIQVKEKLEMDKLDTESRQELDNVDDNEYVDDDPATDPVSIIFEALNTYPKLKSTDQFYLYTLFLPSTSSIQKIIDQSQGDAISKDKYRKFTKKEDLDEKSVVKKDIEKGDKGFPKCKTLHIFFTFQSKKDKAHYSDLLLFKDSEEETSASYSINEEQKVEIARYNNHTYFTLRDNPKAEKSTEEIEIPSYQDRVTSYFVDSDKQLFFSSTPNELKMRAIIILERILFPLFKILCEDDWRVECWDTTTSHLTQTSVINMAEKTFLMDCINEIADADEEIQNKFYATGQYRNLFEAQKFKFNSPIAPLTRDRDIIIEKPTTKDSFVESNPLRLGQYYDLFLKRNNKPWCHGKQNTLLCFGRIDPKKVKDSPNKEIKAIIDDIRYEILRYKKSRYISKSHRK
ncbi:hypothetical protein CYY_004397 [Polysphondylium violaceum]|uniref:Uncharacterized protein n=1 Tax=Polysphondylium violaceum TaxID=133409 RepID=A0A8J4PUP0_9MYCE|nr:hypothetical protein CYY_004397 [Polysphondylium violaceum]